MNTVSPGFNDAMSVSPTQAVRPGMPRAPSSDDDRDALEPLDAPGPASA